MFVHRIFHANSFVWRNYHWIVNVYKINIMHSGLGNSYDTVKRAYLTNAPSELAGDLEINTFCLYLLNYVINLMQLAKITKWTFNVCLLRSLALCNVTYLTSLRHTHCMIMDIGRFVVRFCLTNWCPRVMDCIKHILPVTTKLLKHGQYWSLGEKNMIK